ncbi:hypothetical protein [Methylobacterium oxalidis]|uniref:hypothetical protein n=1 Tax=Methylobacterium oxalidis TaxID=944322 RepID=UPI0011BDAE8D|nr:hypothetical protein [Methylobacterium oxalidis]GJE35066.1 hypothetical protein LDDCCGHA_5284 [Methylobacterium oxalidis]
MTGAKLVSAIGLESCYGIDVPLTVVECLGQKLQVSGARDRGLQEVWRCVDHLSRGSGHDAEPAAALLDEMIGQPSISSRQR